MLYYNYYNTENLEERFFGKIVITKGRKKNENN